MDFLELVTGARTCRRFREAEGMPAGMLDWLIACARVTPCGGNAQALRFAVAESPEACAAVFPALKWAGMLTDWDGPEAGERPTGYVAILGEAGTRAKLNAIDAGIAAQTIQLAAYTRDLGCCIFLSFDPRKIREAVSYTHLVLRCTAGVHGRWAAGRSGLQGVHLLQQHRMDHA